MHWSQADTPIKEKVNSGNIFRITEVIRDLEECQDLLFVPVKSSFKHKAKRLLVDELSAVNNLNPKVVADSIYTTLLLAKEERKNGQN